MNALWLLLLPFTLPSAAPDTLVVCPSAFQGALKPWLAHRRQQGHRIEVLSNQATPRQLRLAIRDYAQGGQLKHIVLVGDAVPNPSNGPNGHNVCIPAFDQTARINVRWGSESEIATDNGYADLDDDQIPDVAIGRLTADSAYQLEQIVEKILTYERSSNLGRWRTQINLVAGVGGFNAVVDGLLQAASKKLITDCIPAAYPTSMTYASWRSPYCPDPRDFRRTTLRQLNNGSLIWAYIGHGQHLALDQVRTPSGNYPIFDADDVALLNCENGSPVAVFLSCHAGAFDQDDDCLAERMLVKTGGPVAIVCGSRVTMPYGMAVMAVCTLESWFQQSHKTLGEVFLEGKRNMIAPRQTGANCEFIDSFATSLGATEDDLAAERLEHVWMFNLLGDPLLRLRHPEMVTVNSPATVDAGHSLEITGRSSVEGKTTVELVCRRDRLTFRPSPRQVYDSSNKTLSTMNTVYREANNHVWVAHSFELTGGTFRQQIQVPLHVRGPCYVRVFVEGENSFAIGAENVYVRRQVSKQKK